MANEQLTITQSERDFLDKLYKTIDGRIKTVLTTDKGPNTKHTISINFDVTNLGNIAKCPVGCIERPNKMCVCIGL